QANEAIVHCHGRALFAKEIIHQGDKGLIFTAGEEARPPRRRSAGREGAQNLAEEVLHSGSLKRIGTLCRYSTCACASWRMPSLRPKRNHRIFTLVPSMD